MRKGFFLVFASWFMVVPLSAFAAGQISRTRSPQDDRRSDVERFRESWKVLEPITRRNLSVYPVVSTLKSDTSGFLTLDEGLASGEIKIAERGQVENTLYRRRGPHVQFDQNAQRLVGGESVNELVLLNYSSRPLILLAGEVISGGKQNRIIGADLVVPPKSNPIPLTVFCVEQGRWSASRGAFGAAKAMAHPGIRKEAQTGKSQAGVWESVARSSAALGAASPTSDYTEVLNSPRARRELDEVVSSIEAEYERELREHLRGRGAVGVVVAINGELVWSDVFSSPDLFRKYWPKLLRSYVIEAESHAHGVKSVPSPKDAEAFLSDDRGHLTLKVEPGAYRRTEVSGRAHQIVALEALGKFEDSGLFIHYNKMERE